MQVARSVVDSLVVVTRAVAIKTCAARVNVQFSVVALLSAAQPSDEAPSSLASTIDQAIEPSADEPAPTSVSTVARCGSTIASMFE